MKTMYKGLVNSPETTITNNIGTNDTIIYVLDPARVPSDLPNLMVLGTGTNAETIKVTAIEGNALTVERGFQGIAKDWLAGTIIARNFTEYDYAALVDNINELVDNINELELTKETPDGAQAKADAAEDNAKTHANDLFNELFDNLASHLADYATFKDDTETEIDNLKSSVSNGKNSIATAITDKGVSASGSDTFSQLSTKIGQIITPTGNAVAGDVLAGKTFSKLGSAGLTGTMPNRGAVANTITTQGGQYTIPAGYHNGAGKVTASFANLVAGNIKSGVNIGGVVGTLVEGKKFASGTTASFRDGSWDYIEVTNLNFRPEIVIAKEINTYPYYLFYSDLNPDEVYLARSNALLSYQADCTSSAGCIQFGRFRLRANPNSNYEWVAFGD